MRRLLVHRWMPVPDIYGVRFILKEQDVSKASQTILESFLPEDRFPYPLPYIRDLTDPYTHRTYYSDSRYQAIHIYVAFGEAEVPNIGEVKLMTPEQLKIDIKTRKQY